MSSSTHSTVPAPSEILIIGAGVFGLSTALSLIKRPAYNHSKITIIDQSPTLPNPSGSSVDANRIIRSDYALLPYARLAAEAQTSWRDQTDSGWGGQGRYNESGFVLVANIGAEEYVRDAFENVQRLAREGIPGMNLDKIQDLPDRETIRRVGGWAGALGDRGYVNWNSGWADARECVAFAIRKLEAEGGDRVTIRKGCKVTKMLFESPDLTTTIASTLGLSSGSKKKCIGVELESGEQIQADLTIFAGGAWTPSVINLQGRVLATGQVIAYINLTDEEQAELEDKPVILNLSTSGGFTFPPRGNLLKIAVHAYGYQNPEYRKPDGDGLSNLVAQEYNSSPQANDVFRVSVPKVGISIPKQGEEDCRAVLRELVPHLADRPFSNTRVCWYCDTPEGDFLIDYHPAAENLFLATGGSGHGFKFLPNLGEKIVDAIEHNLDPELRDLWKWLDDPVDGFQGAEDGSRSGRKGLILDEEFARRRSSLV